MRPFRCSSLAGFHGRSMWIRSWQRTWRLMPSRAASVQIRFRRGSFSGSALNWLLSFSRRSVEVAPVKLAIRSSRSRSDRPSRSRQLQPTAGMLILGEKKETSAVPSTLDRHVLPDPGRQLDHAGVRSACTSASDRKHFVNKGKIPNSWIYSSRCFVLFLGDQGFCFGFILWFVFQFNRFKQGECYSRGLIIGDSRCEGRSVRSSVCVKAAIDDSRRFCRLTSTIRERPANPGGKCFTRPLTISS